MQAEVMTQMLESLKLHGMAQAPQKNGATPI
ncbi:hypothetical protein SAMN05446635_5752 [Burkholderia sp. OK233]|nr:hypothetical protein SAMN05446635_5752 [Burkholderia sp. OK233]